MIATPTIQRYAAVHEKKCPEAFGSFSKLLTILHGTHIHDDTIIYMQRVESGNTAKETVSPVSTFTHSSVRLHPQTASSRPELIFNHDMLPQFYVQQPLSTLYEQETSFTKPQPCRPPSTLPPPTRRPSVDTPASTAPTRRRSARPQRRQQATFPPQRSPALPPPPASSARRSRA